MRTIKWTLEERQSYDVKTSLQITSINVVERFTYVLRKYLVSKHDADKTYTLVTIYFVPRVCIMKRSGAIRAHVERIIIYYYRMVFTMLRFPFQSRRPNRYTRCLEIPGFTISPSWKYSTINE